MAKTPKTDSESDAMVGWEPVPSRSRAFDAADADQPLPQADRVAREPSELRNKYVSKRGSRSLDSASTNPESDAPTEHAELQRRKKKDAVDNDTNAKTFVVVGGKPVGAQG